MDPYIHLTTEEILVCLDFGHLKSYVGHYIDSDSPANLKLVIFFNRKPLRRLAEGLKNRLSQQLRCLSVAADMPYPQLNVIILKVFKRANPPPQPPLPPPPPPPLYEQALLPGL